MEKLIPIFEKAAAALEKAAIEHGPKVVETTLLVVQVGAVKEILQWLLVLIASVVSFYFADKLRHRCAKGGWAIEEETEAHDVAEQLGMVVLYIVHAVTAVASILAFPLYAMVGLFQPEVYLVAKALGL